MFEQNQTSFGGGNLKHLYQNGGVAQMVERLTPDQKVACSSHVVLKSFSQHFLFSMKKLYIRFFFVNSRLKAEFYCKMNKYIFYFFFFH